MSIVGIRSIVIIDDNFVTLSVFCVWHGYIIDASLCVLRWHVEPPCTKKEYRRAEFCCEGQVQHVSGINKGKILENGKSKKIAMIEQQLVSCQLDNTCSSCCCHIPNRLQTLCMTLAIKCMSRQSMFQRSSGLREMRKFIIVINCHMNRKKGVGKRQFTRDCAQYSYNDPLNSQCK